RSELTPEDFGGVMVTVYVPSDIDTRVRELLATRLGQVASSGGLSGVQMRSRFVLLPRVTVLDATAAGGLEKVVTVSVEVTFEARNFKTGVPIHQWTATVAGSGRDKETAVVQAISSIKASSPALTDFARETHDRIVAQYSQNCDEILKEANAVAKDGRNDAAFAALFAVPVAAASCHSKAMAVADRIASGNYDSKVIPQSKGSTSQRGSVSASASASVSGRIAKAKISAAAYFNGADSRVLRLDFLK
ncbi:MAG: hypothetical protein ABJB66_01180, partial [Gemmatimonadaceae bacterium]